MRRSKLLRRNERSGRRPGGTVCVRLRSLAFGAGFRSGCSWQCEIEGCPFAFFGLRPYSAAVTQDDSMHDGESNAGAFEFVLVMEALEHSEELARVSHVKADTVVAHNNYLFRFVGVGADFNPRRVAGARVFERVGKQVVQHHAEHGRVALDLGKSADLPFDGPALQAI